jgi:SAM-dependent methyltransferase
MQDWYKDWFNSPYYHLLYNHRDEKEAAHFINNLLTFLNPPAGSKMLDIACGKGRHAFQLSSRGHDVTGIDLSISSIQEAKQNESDTLQFFVHDMRQPFRINDFDYAFNFFTSFGYFDSKGEHHSAIRTIAQSLKKGGVLVLDYLNAEKSDITAESDQIRNVEGIIFHISKGKDSSYLTKKIMIEDPALSSPLTFMEKVAAFNIDDFEEMFLKEGLIIEHIFGDYELNPFQKATSPRLIMVARKLDQ